MSGNNRITGLLLIAISAASFGLMPIFATMAYASGVSTYTLLFLRFLVAGAFMLLLMLVKRLPMPSKKDMLMYFLLGALGYVGQSFCYFMALNYASPSVVALLLYTYPALVMLGSAIFLKERLTARKLMALCLALLGAFVIMGAPLSAKPMGILLSVLAAVFYTVYILISARIVRAGMSIQSSAFIMLGAALVYGLMNLFMGYRPPTRLSGLVAVALIALISTVVALWTFFAGMQRTGPSTAALVSILEPLVTVLASVLILSEKMTINIIAGGGLVLAALLVTAMPRKKAG